MNLDVDRQTLVLSVVVFLVFSLGGFYLAFYTGDTPEQKYVSGMNVTADSENNIVTASFDGREIDLMHEDSRQAHYYLDLDRDGSFDLELEGLVHDGQVREHNRTVTLNRTNYRLYFRYRDDAGEEDDSWFRLYRVVEQ
ncbi:MAG: hypothetical protein ABEJ07_05670 [Candidatus Nanohaloarchaea archaeon]